MDKYILFFEYKHPIQQAFYNIIMQFSNSIIQNMHRHAETLCEWI